MMIKGFKLTNLCDVPTVSSRHFSPVPYASATIPECRAKGMPCTVQLQQCIISLNEFQYQESLRMPKNGVMKPFPLLRSPFHLGRETFWGGGGWNAQQVERSTRLHGDTYNRKRNSMKGSACVREAHKVEADVARVSFFQYFFASICLPHLNILTKTNPS